MVLKDVARAFLEYIYNDVPAHLLDVSQMTLVDRSALWDIHLPDMEGIMEDIIEGARSSNKDQKRINRKDAIRGLIAERLKYATLSHRWSEKGEPTFEDISSDQPRTGAKWDKISQFCTVARDMGCSLAWIDTCCIDKSSSAELDEAIRSMFRWYRNSNVCIAYLAQSTSVEDCGDDDWYMRGWTLQELLAPRRIKFFGKGWQPFGEGSNDKADDHIMRKVSSITNIPDVDLRSFVPGTNRVPEKMVWASKRETTRIEDMAYCLIGIFDVSLMVAYGEGPQAFYRLRGGHCSDA
ncbi:heterokaryon incompatibility protein-domain-containing protein [Suillus ampliporus]|nr:heterokaryon incompatibility protein-domain-containing protein [Suillus ampliporus]